MIFLVGLYFICVCKLYLFTLHAEFLMLFLSDDVKEKKLKRYRTLNMVLAMKELEL